ncbi:hypothetical protein [Rhizobium sp. Root1220]|uniref:hypothetical protein n=1 Tax=Rhizobium sp. Root1220 TaxID=1736432 RepID=UPI0006F40EB4|nr:hypothetical protein [Rhizobium sp. Root1220]KQV79262.1 hypothetical protein ASC90_26455 [Rhizobium sp. Root1220]
MSSVPPPRLNSEELAIVQQVLADAGYTGDVMISSPTDFNYAAKLLIGLFRRGMRDPLALKAELDAAFGPHSAGAAVDCRRRIVMPYAD